tara:strand:- start:2770 stop:2877 length:108 start_codon:yes stop_codon:yes gene_type:complete
MKFPVFYGLGDGVTEFLKRLEAEIFRFRTIHYLNR